MTLNWRHKACLFLTGMALGCGLFLEVSAKQAAGIALIGVALSWLFGSLTRRALGVAFAIGICAVGLYIATAPIWSDWNSTKESAAEYEVGISDLQYAVRTASPLKGLPQEATLGAVVTMPNTTANWLRPDAWLRPSAIPESYIPSFNDQGQQEIFLPKAVSDVEIMHVLESSFLLPKPIFSLGSAVRSHIWPVLGGFALFASGLSILGWMFRRRAEQTSTQKSDVLTP